MRHGLLCLFLVAGAPGCRRFTPPTDTVSLPIADRDWDEGAPPEGWCGETSIQMVALHFGAWVPQREAHRLGRAQTPDLWEADVAVALDALGLRWKRGPARDVKGTLDFTVASLRAGHPVILGLKFSESSGHPEWDVDHLVVAPGFSPRGLTLNTNLGGQRVATWDGLLSREGSAGFTLVNDTGATWAYAVEGFQDGRGERVEVRSRDGGVVTVRLRDGGEVSAADGQVQRF